MTTSQATLDVPEDIDAGFDATIFGDWAKRGIANQSADGTWRITAEGEAELWATRPLGDRERNVASFLDENVIGVLADLGESKSLSGVVAQWNPPAAYHGIRLSELDMYRTILRWKLNPPPWFNEGISASVAKVAIDFPTK